MTTFRTLSLLALAAVLILIYTQLTLFVIHPSGAIPEGRTLVITRMNNSAFIDSPDGMCERIMDGVSLMCRIIVMGTVVKNSTVLVRLPYSDWLYDISTGGKSYSR